MKDKVKGEHLLAWGRQMGFGLETQARFCAIDREFLSTNLRQSLRDTDIEITSYGK
jgi:hypothetical protein